MDYQDVINEFSKRELNEKTNNLIIIGDYFKELIDNIPNKCIINDNKEVLNIKINISQVGINNILSYILNKLNIKELISFNNLFDLIKFQKILSINNIYCQLIIYNLDILSIDDQMLLNELYYFYSENYNVTSIVNKEFNTYFLRNGKVLDDRENFQKYRLDNNKKALKKEYKQGR